jgi:hypothetical protein
MAALAGALTAEAAPSLAIGDATAAEPPVGAGVVSLLVSLSEPSATVVTVAFETTPDTATAADFTPLTGTVEIPAGATRAMIRIPVLPDTAVEETEQFFVRLSQPQGAELTRAVGRATVINTGFLPVVHSPGGILYENGPTIPIPLHIGNEASPETSVRWQMQPWFNGPTAGFATATAGADFDGTPGTASGNGIVEIPLAALPDDVAEPSFEPNFIYNPTEVLALRFQSDAATAAASFVPDFRAAFPDPNASEEFLPRQTAATTDGTWIASGTTFPFFPNLPSPAQFKVYRRNAALQRSWEEAPPIELPAAQSPYSILMRRGRLAINTSKGLAIFEAPEGAVAAWRQVNTPDPEGSPLPSLDFNAAPADFVFDGDTLITQRLSRNSNEQDVLVFLERLAPTGAWGVVQEEPLPDTVRLRSTAVDGDLAVVATVGPGRARIEEWRRTGAADRPWVRQGEIPSPPPPNPDTGSYARLALTGGALHGRRFDGGFPISGHVFRCSSVGQWYLEQMDLPALGEEIGDRTAVFLSSDVLLLNTRIFARNGPIAAPWQQVGILPNPINSSDTDLPRPLDAQGGVLIQHLQRPPDPATMLVSAPGARVTIFDDESAYWEVGLPGAGSSDVFEPESGTKPASLVVYGPVVPFPTTVGIRTTGGGTATPGVDYLPIDLQLHDFSYQGFGRPYVNLPLIADRELEPNETILVELHAPSYGRLGTTNPQTFIVRDIRTRLYAAAPTVFFTEPETGHLDQGVLFQLSLPVTTEVTIPVIIETRGATPGVDFTVASPTVTVPTGARSFMVPVRVLADTLDEPVESFILRLGNSGFLTTNVRVQVNLLDQHVPGRGTEADVYQLPQNLPFSAGGAGDPAPGVAANDPGSTGPVRLRHPPEVGTLALDPSGTFTYAAPVNFIGQTRFAYEARLGDGLGTLVDGAATWKYLHPLDGVDPATAQPEFATTWMAPGFDDAAWATGTGLMGYGGFGTANTAPDTNIGTPPSGQRYTAYFRHTFNAPRALTADLEIQFSCDDGAIFYLHGAEIGRFSGQFPNPSFATEADTYKLLQSSAVDSNEETAVRTLTFRSVPLAETGNVLAVSVHNAANSSSDLGFRLISLKAVEQWSEPTPVILTVTDASLPPVLAADSSTCEQNGRLDSSFLTTGGLYANDALLDRDGTPFDPIFEIEATGTNAGGQVTAVPQTGEFQYTPPLGYYGPDAFSYRVRDKDGWSAFASVTIDVTPSTGYDLWRKTHLGAAAPTAETDPDRSAKNNGFNNLQSYYFMEDQFEWLPVSPTPLTVVGDAMGRTGIEFTGKNETEVQTTVEASSSLQPNGWQVLARWQGDSLAFVAPGVVLQSQAGIARRTTVLESSPPPGPRYYRVRLEMPPP